MAPSPTDARARRHLLLTGVPGVGKTTVLLKVAGALRGRRLAGFYTEEIRADGDRRGFRAVTLDGAARVMASVEIRGGPRVGRYGVDLAVVEWLAESALAPRPGVELYLVDEIGKMECASPRFVAAVRRLLDGATPVLATVARKGTGLIAEVTQRPDVELWEVTRASRDGLPARILARLQ